MSKRESDFFKLADLEKQKIPHPDEIDPNNSFIETSIASLRAAQRYKLKGLKLDAKIRHKEKA
jgi:hypothetical protein